MPGLIIDKVGGGSKQNPNIHIESNYSKLVTLRNESKLVPGQKYSFEYLHKYFVDGSNSTGKVNYLTIDNYVYGYATFGEYHPDLTVGKTVIITALPEGYAGNLKIGNTTTVYQVDQAWYFTFYNGMQNVVGLEFKYYLKRYNTIAENAVIEDANGRPIMRPSGIINTEVHDGFDYMDQPGNLNKPILPETIILKAKSENSFEDISESFTYPGDKLQIDIDNTEIYNDNKEKIGERNGFVNRRFNANIDMPIDWRNTKYRRWCLDLNSRTKLLNQHLDINTTRLGFDGKWLFTAANATVDNPIHFYVANEYEGELICLDKNANKDIFTYTCIDPTAAKDFSVIQFDEDGEPFRVESVNIKEFSNSVFEGYSLETDHFLVIDSHKVTNSTFVCNPKIEDKESEIISCTIIDDLYITGSDILLEGCVLLSRVLFVYQSDNSRFFDSIFASMRSDEIITLGHDNITGDPLVSWLYFEVSETTAYDSVFSGKIPKYRLATTKFCTSSIFFYYCPIYTSEGPGSGKYAQSYVGVNGGRFNNVGMRFTNHIDKVVLTDLIFSNENLDRLNRLYQYDNNENLENILLKKNDATSALYYEYMDADYNRTFIELSSQKENPIDLSVGIVVDDAAPIVGNNVIFTITASNNLGNAATNVLVNCLLPAGYTYVSDDVAGNYDSVTGIWNVGDLAISTSDIINITAIVEVVGPYQVDVSIESNEIETAPEDNTANVTTIPVAAINDLSTTIVVDNEAPTIGDNVVFTITGNNNGNKPATNVQATSLLPAGYTYVSDDGVASYDPVTGIWTIGNLDIGASNVINITATVEAAGPYQVDVTITGSEAEDMPVDNTDTISPVPIA